MFLGIITIVLLIGLGITACDTAFTEAQYRVSFFWEETDTDHCAVISANKDSFIILPEGTGIEIEGYTFNGWCEKADGDEYIYLPGYSYKVSKDVQFYAKWIIKISVIGDKIGDGKPIEREPINERPVQPPPPLQPY